MANSEERSLDERVAQLERSVENLQGTLSGLIETLARREGAPAPKRPPAPAVTTQRPRRAAPAPSPVSDPQPWYAGRGSEFWLNRIGIGLLLFGVAFLFKYSVDQGWLTPPIRVAFGLALGVGLAFIGLRVHGHRRWFGQAMLGAASATLYITGFAAFQLFQLVSYPVALAFLVLVTVLTFWAAVRQDDAALALLAALGGLGTPFLLYTEAGSLTGLVTYTCVLLAGTSGIYLLKGWRTLLWTTVVGGWYVLLIGYDAAITGAALFTSVDRWALQSGVLFAWLAFWGVPVVREVLAARDPDRWPRPSLGVAARFFAADPADLKDRHVAVLAVSMPLIALFFSREIWAHSETLWGWTALLGATLYGSVWWWLDRTGVDRGLVSAHAVSAAVLLAVGLQFFFESHALILTLAVEGVALYFAGKRLDDRSVTISAHLLFAVVAVWLATRLVADGTPGTVVFNTRALTDLAVVVAGVAVAMASDSKEEAKWYWGAAHLALLAWLWRELSRLPGGEAYVTIAWGVYGITLLLVGLRRDSGIIRKVALGTLLLVVAKLFLVDLARLEGIWRVLLFLGFGGLFLVLSYYFRALWKAPGGKSGSRTGA